MDSARLTVRFGQLRRTTRFDREERSQHQANLRLQSGRILASAAQDGSIHCLEHCESLDERLGKTGGNAHNESGRADRS